MAFSTEDGMTKLAPNSSFITPAGAITVPDWLEPYFACEKSDKESLFVHMKAIDLPPSAWNEWREDIECERVGDIRTFYHLFTIWLRVGLWQKSCRVSLQPRDEWGAMIFNQIRLNTVKIDLTPNKISLLFNHAQQV